MKKGLFYTVILLIVLIKLATSKRNVKDINNIESKHHEKEKLNTENGYDLNDEKDFSDFAEELSDAESQLEGSYEIKVNEENKLTTKTASINHGHKNKHSKHHKKHKKCKGKHKNKCCKKHHCGHEKSTPQTTTIQYTTKAPTYPSSFMQVVKKCKKLFVKYLKLTASCHKDNQNDLKHSKDRVQVKFISEGADWKNTLAESILKEFQSQINKLSLDYDKLQISIKTNKNVGYISIDSPDSTYNLNFKIDK